MWLAPCPGVPKYGVPASAGGAVAVEGVSEIRWISVLPRKLSRLKAGLHTGLFPLVRSATKFKPNKGESDLIHFNPP